LLHAALLKGDVFKALACLALPRFDVHRDCREMRQISGLSRALQFGTEFHPHGGAVRVMARRRERIAH